MNGNIFFVSRLKHEPGRFIVMPMVGPDRLYGLVAPEQTFRGSEAEIQRYLADKGLPPSQIQSLIELANDSPEMDAPEYVEGGSQRAFLEGTARDVAAPRRAEKLRSRSRKRRALASPPR